MTRFEEMMHRFRHLSVIRALAVVALSSLGALSAHAQSAPACPDGPWFCLETLNTGLEAPSGIVDRDTPRAAMESFQAAARAGNWAEAAHVLDLSGIPAGRQAGAGPHLAEQLHTVLRRKTVIPWEELLDRPDARDAEAASDAAMAGEARRSLLLWTLELETHPVAIRLNRVAGAGQDPVWVFSRQTVGDIPALYDRYGPGRIEALLPAKLSQTAIFGFMWWELMALPLFLLLALLAGRGLWSGLNAVARRAGRPVVAEIARTVRGPATTAAVTGIVLFLGSHLLVFSGKISTILDPLAWLGLLVAGLWLTVNAIEVVLDRLMQFDQLDLTQSEEADARVTATRIAAFRRAIVILVSLIGGAIFLLETNIFQNLGLTVLGTAGALTLVLGFAARRVLGNIMSSLQISLNQSARIGDRIVFKDYLCHVERINFTFVQLRDWNGTRVVVPVEEFVSTSFENWSLKEPEMLRIIKLKCAHGADVEALRDAFMEIIDELDADQLGDIDDAKVRVAGQDVFGKDVWFALPCADPNTSWDVACKAREKLIARGEEIARRDDTVIFPEATPAEAA